MPFNKKMDDAIQFIDEVLQDNILQFENFGTGKGVDTSLNE